MSLLLKQSIQHYVIICEPDELVLNEIVASIENLDIDVIAVTTKEALLSRLAEVTPSLIMLADTINQQCGFELCSQLKKEPSTVNTEILMLVESVNSNQASLAFQSGASDFELKSLCKGSLEQRALNILNRNTGNNHRMPSKVQIERFDPLTGLANRRSFFEEVDKRIASDTTAHNRSGLLVIDLDNFKRFNDTLGHDFGDQLLVDISKKISKALRPTDLLMFKADNITPINKVARIGGNLFTIYIENIEDRSALEKVAQRLIRTINRPVKINSHEIVVSPSIGIAMYPKDGADVKCLLKNAEKAMYTAKSKGGCGFRNYSTEMNSSARKRLNLENDLRYALLNDELHLHYQPQIDSRAGRVTSVEALLRWSHPKLGEISPDEFIPIAEESGMIVSIGNWVIFNACKQAKLWLDKGAHFTRMAVNVSACQFDHHDFLENVIYALKENNLDPSHLELELTESIIMNDVGESVQKLLNLKKLGVRLAVDDFGTGYSSLAYLKSLPIDTLKIDRSFIADITSKDQDCAIVSAIMALAEKLNLKVVAEGVEEINQINFLRNNYCTLLQGYYFSRPNRADVIGELLINQYTEAIHVDG